MPICIECRSPIDHLYTSYSKADDRSLGKGVRLTQCQRCKRFADKYLEHDFVVLFIDLVLIKPQVYRHLLFNRLGRKPGDGFDPSIIRLGVLLLLFDVYLTWARIEKASPQSQAHSGYAHLLPTGGEPPPQSPISPVSAVVAAASAPQPLPMQPSNLLSSQSLLTQYMFFLLLCALETIAFHLPIRLITTMPLPSFLLRPIHNLTNPSNPRQHESGRELLPPTTLLGSPPYPHPNRISTALLVSSCTKLFPMLRVIWEYDLPSSASAVSWAVIVNNVAALEILLECGYARAALLAGLGAACRGLVGRWLLDLAGLGHTVGRWGVEWLDGRAG